MIRLLIIIVALAVGFLKAHGSIGDTLQRSVYGIELNQFLTGSGYSSGTELLFSVTEGKRSFNIGFYYCTEVKRITGIIAHHEVQLLRNSYRRTIKPYLFYNGIARLTKLEDINDVSTGVKSSGIYKTFEHHIGLGLRAQINRNIYLSGSLGYGMYFGSVKKPVVIEGINEIAGSNGLSHIVKIGFGLIL